MNRLGSSAVPVADATELARLHQLIVEARAELADLRQVIVASGHDLAKPAAAELLQANEQLLISTLRAQSDADAAALALVEVARSAERDDLTELPNRLLFLDRLGHAIAQARRQDTQLALLFVDLDNFKQINDTLGHAVGDEVLKHAARCLTSSIREADTVSRHGGDEFLILLHDLAEACDAALVADKMIAALATPFLIGADTLQLSASIGISLHPRDGDDADTLIAHADAAMYEAKRAGLGHFVFHGQSSTPELSQKRPMFHSLPHCLDVVAEHERLHEDMVEVAEQLLISALNAQGLQADAEHAQQRQAGYMAVLAHELRNPLTPIRTAAALLGHAPADETVLPRLQGVIERQVAHLSRLVNDLLDVSRASTGKLRIEHQDVDLAVIIDDAVEACHPAMEKRSQHFALLMPDSPMNVRGDPVRLAQILCNLLDNASKYTPESGDINLSIVVGDGVIRMTVADSGIGITPKTLPHVFEPFVQDPHATGYNAAGLGIGLTLVHELVEAHGGTAVAASAGHGCGSQFVVTLPSASP